MLGFFSDLYILFSKTFSWTAGVFEIFVILASTYPSTIPSRWVLKYLTHFGSPSFQVTPAFIFSWICALSGAYIRRRCYSIMGKMFTFEISIRKNHRLITTGPYGIVRHPGYSGAALSLFGALAYNTLPGAYFREECSALLSPWLLQIILPAAWLVATIIGIGVLRRRISKEDSMLREEFGAQWDSWASRVPYSLIPGIY